MRLEVLEGGNALFLTLDEVKSWLRIVGDDEDELLASLILASEEFFENYTDRALTPKIYKVCFDGKGAILPKSPVIEILEPKELNVKWDYQTAEALNFNGEIIFKAGYKNIPQIIKIWALNKIASWYENRENVVIGTIASDLPRSHIDCVLDQFKVRRF